MMTLGYDFYRRLDETLAATITGSVGFTELAQTAPVSLPISIILQRQERLRTLRLFFERVMTIFHAVVHGKSSPALAQLLFNDVPESYGSEFHRNLPVEVWTVPQFFRTDESMSGRILEVQCPGSGWGDLQLLANTYSKYFSSEALNQYQPSQWVAEEIVQLCGDQQPRILHLLDNSSNPSSMRYLIATTQPPLRYWGYEKTVRNSGCNFVRSHSFFGLVAENLFRERVQDAIKGLTRFDLPPLLVFDQKIPLCLPFLDETRSQFTDDVRDIIAYSYPVFGNGFRDIDGAWVSIRDFIERPPAMRRYFLKYAGSDVSINWGSRSVFRLNDRKAASLLSAAAEDAKRGRFWLIQPELSDKESVTYFSKDNGDETQSTLTTKWSCFYGPTRLIGIRTMHRHHYKVHGQDDTVLGLAVPGYFEEMVNSSRDLV